MEALPLKCVIVDDEPLALELLGTYIARLPQLTLLNSFEDAVSALEYLQISKPDLLFVDINMPDVSGLDLAKALQEKPMIIFTTAHKQFAFEGYELEAVDYLLKPINFERFQKAVLKALDLNQYKSMQQSLNERAFIYVNSEYRMIRIDLEEIEYIESMDDYLKIHISNKKPVLTLMSLKKILEVLPAKRFKRIHRSFIIPIDKIKSIQNRKIQLNDVVLPIGDSYSEIVKTWLNFK